MIEIKTKRGQVGYIDDIDAELASFAWNCQRQGLYPSYLCRDVYLEGKHTRVSIHRAVMERVLGRALDSEELVDHVDGNPLNNQRGNLRLCTRAQNQQNSRRRRTRNPTSQYKGVTRPLPHGKFVAHIKVNKKSICLGRFTTAEEAYAAYCEAARKYFGEFARFE